MSRHPTDPIANCTLGRVLRRQNQTAEAVPYLKAAIAANPSYKVALLELGQSELQLGRPGDAVGPLEQAVKADPGDAQAHFVLGTAYMQLGRHEEGVRERKISQGILARQHASGKVAPAH